MAPIEQFVLCALKPAEKRLVGREGGFTAWSVITFMNGFLVVSPRLAYLRGNALPFSSLVFDKGMGELEMKAQERDETDK